MAEDLALLDLGSNAARFLLARVKPGSGYRVLREERVQTRLGGGRDGKLPGDAVDRTLRAAHRFLERVRNGNGMRVVAVATAAVRDAPNRDRLLDGLWQREGVRVRVLSGREEARLGTSAALCAVPMREGAVVDLGGGSLQISRVRHGAVGTTRSLPLGAVRLTRRWLRSDPPSAREMRRLRAEIRDQLLGSLPPAGRHDALVAMGGTVRTLARIHMIEHGVRRRRRHGLELAQAHVTALRASLEGTPLARRRRIAGLRAERADIIVAGAVVIEELMVFGGYPTLTVCTAGVRDGILLGEVFA